MEVLRVDVLPEGAELADADGAVAVKFDPDCADVGGWGGVGAGWGVGVFIEHGLGGAGGEVHFVAAGGGVLV